MEIEQKCDKKVEEERNRSKEVRLQCQRGITKVTPNLDNSEFSSSNEINTKENC